MKARTFDYNDAARRYRDGESVRDLAARFGVTESAVRRAINPQTRARLDAYSIAYAMSAVCVDCGTRCAKYRSGVKGPVAEPRCYACAMSRMATSVRDGELRCATCGEWKPDLEFPWSRAARKHRRGRHQSCRACLTVLRRNYRERHKVPCVGCGKPALPPSEKGARGFSKPRCRDCYIKSVRAA